MSKGYLRNVVNEAYVKKPLNEATERGTLYVLTQKNKNTSKYVLSPFPGEYVLGIYNSLDRAKKAYNEYIRKGGDAVIKYCVVKAVTLNTSPDYNYMTRADIVIDQDFWTTAADLDKK